MTGGVIGRATWAAVRRAGPMATRVAERREAWSTIEEYAREADRLHQGSSEVWCFAPSRRSTESA